MNMEQALPNILDWDQTDDDQFVCYERTGSDTLQFLQFGQHKTPSLYSYGPAVRDHDLIHFVFSGSGDVTMAGRRFHVTGGELFFIPAHTVSFYQADEYSPWMYAWIGFDGAWGRAMLEETGLSLEKPVANMRDISCIYNIVSKMSEQMFEPCGYLKLLSGALLLLDDLARGPKARAPWNEVPLRDSEMMNIDVRINEVINHLDQNFCKPLNVQALADEMKLSRAYLSDQFSKRTGCSIKTYVTRLRMEYACFRMIEARKTIRDVAEECGYDDPLYFSRVFKNTYGVSPQRYRELQWQKLSDTRGPSEI